MSSSREIVLVAVSGSPWSKDLIRKARALAESLDASWIALHVLTHGRFTDAANRERARVNLELAENLGAEAVTIRGENSTKEIIAFAIHRHVTKIVIGQTVEGRLFKKDSWWSPANTIMRKSFDFDVYVVKNRNPGSRSERDVRRYFRKEASGLDFFINVLWTVLCMAGALGISLLLERLGVAEANIIMAHLLGAFLASLRTGPMAALVTVFWAVLQFNFFFTQPRLTFAVYDVGYLPVFAIMFVVGTVSASLAARLRRQTKLTRKQEVQTYQLYLIGQSLAVTKNMDEMLQESCRQLEQFYDVDVAIYLPEDNGVLIQKAQSSGYRKDVEDRSRIEECYAEARPINVIARKNSRRSIRYAPIYPEKYNIGVAVLVRRHPETEAMDSMHMNTALSLIGRSIDRERLVEEHREASLSAETERVRSMLLRSVSHDLRTPLAGIAGTAEALRFGYPGDSTISAAAEEIEAEAQRMSLLVENIMNLTRLQEDPTAIRRSPESGDDIMHAAAEAARKRYKDRRISLHFSEAPQIVEVDPVLIQQLLLNYIDNAVKYSPDGEPIELSTRMENNCLSLIVRDYGNGITPEITAKVFEKFYRGESNGDYSRGSGLGLYICRTIAHAHDGDVFVETANGGGSQFGVSLPLKSRESEEPDGENDDSDY